MEITIDLGKLDKALKDIEAYKKQFEANVTETVKQATEIGQAEAQTRFAIAKYDGTNDVRVTSTVRKKTGTVTASGESVLFVEFGTGLEAENPRDIPQGVYKAEYPPGSWSEGPEGKGHWDNPNGWFYAHGKRTKGNPANKCMYDATKEVERNLGKIAREVFK